MRKLIKSCAIAAMLCGAQLAQANLIVNGDFEQPQLSGKQWAVYTSIPGWTTVSGSGIEIQHNTIVQAESGNQYVELDSYNNSTMAQVIDTQIGGHYELNFFYRPRTNNGGNDNGINVFWDDVGSSLAGFTPSNLVLSISDQLARAYSGWSLFTLDLVATSERTALSFAAVGLNNSLGGFVDNVSLNAQVPEPATIALLSLGLLALMRRRNNA